MTIKIKNDTLLTAEPLLIQLANIDMKVKGAIAINQALIKVKDALRGIVEVRNKIIKDNTRVDEEGKPIHGKDDKGVEQENLVMLTEEGIEKLKELSEVETETGIEPIDMASFGDCVIKAAILHDLNWLWTK